MDDYSENKLIFGCASLSSLKSAHNALKLLNEVYENGITHFDTAPTYGKGYSEALLGKFIKNRRESIIITTKFGLGSFSQINIPPFFALPLNFLRKKITKSQQMDVINKPVKIEFRTIDKSSVAINLEGSLKRLNTYYIDYYMLHEGLPEFLTGNALQYLLDKKDEGIIRNIGIATNRFNTEFISEDIHQIWDVLQYDSDITSGNIKMPQGFDSKIHFHHSLLKSLNQEPLMNIEHNQVPGFILAKCVKKNPKGKIIFATRDTVRLKNNIKYYKHFLSNSPDNALFQL